MSVAERTEVDAQLGLVAEVDSPGRVRAVLGRLRPHGFLEAYGIVMLLAIVLAIFLLPPLLGQQPNLQDLSRQLLPPLSPDHILGTDNLGRDTFSRVLAGGRVSVFMGVLVVTLAGGVGILVGAVAGFAGGAIDELLMRVADVFLAFPSILLALVVAGALGPSLQNGAIAIAIAWWPAYARIVRGQVILMRDRDFVTASRTLGASPSRILFRSVLPNSLGVLKLILVLDVGFAILAAATLSFFGLGVQPPDSEWGLLIRDAMNHPSAWWMTIFPGVAMILFVSALNFAGGIVSRSVYDDRAR